MVSYRWLSLVAFIGFVLAAIVHVSAVAGIDLSQRFPVVWLLHVGVFAVWFPFVMVSRKRLPRKLGLADIRRSVPEWAFVCGAVLALYAFVNFGVFMIHLGGGGPNFRDGHYILENHGHLIRELSESEYWSLRTWEVRGFSGHWLIFYFIPFAYFLRRPGSEINPPSCTRRS